MTIDEEIRHAIAGLNFKVSCVFSHTEETVRITDTDLRDEREKPFLDCVDTENELRHRREDRGANYVKKPIVTCCEIEHPVRRLQQPARNWQPLGIVSIEN